MQNGSFVGYNNKKGEENKDEDILFVGDENIGGDKITSSRPLKSNVIKSIAGGYGLSPEAKDYLVDIVMGGLGKVSGKKAAATQQKAATKPAKEMTLIEKLKAKQPK